MSGHGEKISRKKQQLIGALLQYPSVREAALVVGISESSAYRWLKEPFFQEHYREARRQILDFSIAQVQIITTEAVQVLREILTDTTTPANSRISAIKIIMEIGIKGLEITDILARLDRLERAMMPE